MNRSDGPRTISSIRQEARAAGVLPPARQAPPTRSFPALPMLAPGSGRQRGMEDVFGSLPVGFSTLGTGPGVIGLDGRSNNRQTGHSGPLPAPHPGAANSSGGNNNRYQGKPYAGQQGGGYGKPGGPPQNYNNGQ